jgi:hypothetical protein
MGKVGKFRHRAEWTGSQAIATGNWNNGGAGLELALGGASIVSAKLSALYIYGTGAASTTSIIAKVTRDAGGDEAVIPDTTATTAFGKTTATDGSAVISIGTTYVSTTTHGDKLYVYLKGVGAGCTITNVVLTWVE